MSDADVDRAGRWLHGQRRVLADWHRDGPPGGFDELVERALAGVDALKAVGAISGESAASWRDDLARAAAGREGSVVAPDDVRHRGEGLATELLAAVPEDPDTGDDVSFEHFEGAVELLGAIGAVDPVAWDAELRERTGEPTEEEKLEETRRLNAGGTEVELHGVIQGPSEPRKGHRLVAALRFADGISFLIDKRDAPDFEWPEWQVTDDLGTDYMLGGSGGGGGDEHVSFRTAVPREARWVELAHEKDPEIAFRLAL